MKFFASALIFCGAAAAMGQAPQVPHKMQFAGLTLAIRDDARREIQKDVDALTLHPKYFNVKVERAKTYFPTIEKIFAEERLPDDFKYLCLQESALISDAVSSSNAVGFWQFKDFTAQEVGLRVDKDIDERMNIASASRGAARYLKQCNHYFNNWVYALQAYQMGAGGVLRAVGDQDLGGRHMEITTDTYWYVKKFLAHKVAFENAVSGKASIEVTNISAGGRSFAEIAKETSIDEQKLRDFNKWLKTDRIPTDKEYAFAVPAGLGSVDFGVLASTPVTSKSVSDKNLVAPPEFFHVNGVVAIRAVKGETIESLASRGNVGIKSFLKYNEMGMDKAIVPGALYFLEKKKRKASEDLYTARKGEDLWTISQRFGIQQKALLRLNRLEEGWRPSNGITLYLNTRKPAGEATDTTSIVLLDETNEFNWEGNDPGKAEARIETRNKNEGQSNGKEILVDASVNDKLHEVKSSDTLYSVARLYGVTIKDLMEWNDKKDFTLSVGEKLRVRPR
jgi:membrane-bound lytic murein transglycosylase D